MRAWLMLAAGVLGACGDDVSVREEAPSDPVTVSATFNGAPLAGAKVLVMRPSGTVMTSAETAASGSVDVPLAPTAVVAVATTVDDPNSIDGLHFVSRSVVLWVGAEPGDELVGAFRTFNRGKELVGSQTAALGADVGGTTPTRWELLAGCGNDDPIGSVTNKGDITGSVFAKCRQPDGKLDFLSLAWADDTLVGWASLVGVTFASGTPITLPAFQAPTTIEVGLAAAPPAVTRVELYGETFRGDLLFHRAGSVQNPDPGEPATASLLVPGAFGDPFLTRVAVELTSLGSLRRLTEYTRVGAPVPAASGPTTVTDLLPPFATATLSTSGGTASMTYSLAASVPPSTPLDGGVAGVTWVVASGSDITLYDWKIVFPPGVSTVHMPPLPAELADWVPPANAGVFGARVFLYASELDDGYDAFRATWQERVEQQRTSNVLRSTGVYVETN